MILKQNVIDWIIVWSLVAIISIGLSILKWNYTMRIMKINTGKSQSDNLMIVKKFVIKRDLNINTKTKIIYKRFRYVDYFGLEWN